MASPTRLKKWGYSDSDLCSLCQKHKGTVPHILSGYLVALADGRYRYRHDSVLKSVAHAIQQKMNRPVDDGGLRVSVSAGPRAQKPLGHGGGLLDQADDWKLLVDLGKQLKFPHFICSTLLRPDIVLYSLSSRIVIIIELSCPSEENLNEAHIFKDGKYDDLVGPPTLVGLGPYNSPSSVRASVRPCVRSKNSQ